MKNLELLFIIATIAIGYWAYNLILMNPADVMADASNNQKENLNNGCDGPFGVDSQKLLNKGTWMQYRYGIFNQLEYHMDYVTKIDLEKNPDGTWYIDNCQLGLITEIYFTAPYPQQNDFKVGDYIAVKGEQNQSGGLRSLS